MVKVKSSNLDAVGYDRKSGVLRILFREGAMYDYHAVPQKIYNQLMEASSKGAFFQEHIVSQFKYSRVNPNLREEGNRRGNEQTAEASSRAR